MLVERCKLDKGDFGVYALPAVKADYNTMDGKEQVVIRLLQGLGDGVKLAFVRAGVVGLGFAGYTSNEIGVDAHSEAYHIDSFLTA